MLARTLVSRASALSARTPIRAIQTAASRRPRASPTLPRLVSPSHCSTRFYSDRSLADEKIEEITELYATAKDEFEMAMEETEKATVYAEDDRAAAVEELEKLQKAYNDIVGGQDKELADEVQKRIGQRIRELEHGVKAMQELAQNHD